MSSIALKRNVQRDGKEWQQVAWAEVLVPEVPNTYGDYYTREAIVEFRDGYMKSNYILDIEHDLVDVKNKDYYVVESFIARDDDPEFVPGSWVLGIKVLSDSLWQDILAGEINGFSFEALVAMEPIEWTYEDEARIVYGVTEEDPFDGHTHTFMVVLGPLNKVISGSTGVTDDHWHEIDTHTITKKSHGHTHRYQVLGD